MTHILDDIQARHAREVRELRRQVEVAERRGYEAGHAVGLREGYSSRVLDQADQKTQLTDRAGYFTGPVTVSAIPNATIGWDISLALGPDHYLLILKEAAFLAADIDAAISDGPEPYEEDVDAARKARIEEDRDF